MKCPFEADYQEIVADPDSFVTAVVSSLASEFLTLPKGEGFIEYPQFELGYEALKKATANFSKLPRQGIMDLVASTPTCLIVIRSILGFTPSEWAYVASQRKGIAVTQGFARSLDRNVRMQPLKPLKCDGLARERLTAMLDVACDLMQEGCPPPNGTTIHRLQKADTKDGLQSIKSLASMGAPYAMLLYERFLGRPFAGHRDSVSELVGDNLESAIEDVLTKAGVSYRKTKRAERVPGFDQAPDFILPDEFNPHVVIEAKITEDDGTARDKVTRIQHLGELSTAGMPAGQQKYQVIACIAGRGFGVRREDMKKMLFATRGKVFTLKTLNRLVECSDLAKFATKAL
ncbi:MAG TPA: hypothetical protein PKI20_08025 [Verrucomicrobiota bacterium]|nr:hypothetical protein [Verrucomicrobiota bacterium]HQL77518.1 hypothetical protein [Verrucomicrobiota bacterium]